MTKQPLPIDRIREAAIASFSRFRPRKILLFGSHARGDADGESDIDLIVVYETDKRFLDRLEELYMAWSLPKAVDILAYTPQEFDMMKESRAFVADAVAEGITLYEGA